MIELAKHIEYLLLENDCVIIPDFGGFIAHNQPSYYDEVEHVFMPPIRTIGFNPQLSMNDGLLVQSYMQAYHTDYSDAIRIISGKVKELKEILYTEGFFELTGIGTLNYNIYRTYEFYPKENGVLSPALYGLGSFLMTPLSVETVEDPAQIDDHRGEDVDSSSEKVVRMLPDWLGNAAAVAIAVVMFFILSAPVENTHIDEGNYASLGSISLFEEIRSHSFATTVINAGQEETEVSKKAEQYPKVVKVEKVAPAVKVEEPTKAIVEVQGKSKAVAKKDVKPAVEPQPIKRKVRAQQFHIIVASLTTSSDAERMLREYKKAGYTGASILGNKDRFRIALCSYEDKTMAYNKLNELKQTDAFKNAWMLTSKK